jgi:hypothetical protein
MGAKGRREGAIVNMTNDSRRMNDPATVRGPAACGVDPGTRTTVDAEGCGLRSARGSRGSRAHSRRCWSRGRSPPKRPVCVERGLPGLIESRKVLEGDLRRATRSRFRESNWTYCCWPIIWPPMESRASLLNQNEARY